jgi:hypothetical protein
MAHAGEPLWFYDQVRNGGPWDFKQQGKPYEDAGNYHYGYMAACSGIPLSVALRAAGWAQRRLGTSKPQWGAPWTGPPYGDDPADQIQIEGGFANAQRWMDELKRKCGLSSLRGCYENYQQRRDKEIDRIIREDGDPRYNRWWDR